jgi:hypothetical protein
MDDYKIVPEFKKPYRLLIRNDNSKLMEMAFTLKVLCATSTEDKLRRGDEINMEISILRRENRRYFVFSKMCSPALGPTKPPLFSVYWGRFLLR